MIITENCAGCCLCSEICPASSIMMHPDKEGFLKPHIDQTTCIHCGLCVKKCPQNTIIKPFGDSKYYSAINSNEKDISASSSGGMFICFARYTISVGGVVCGCIYDENMIARHVCTDDISIVRKMCGSKYVQSNIQSCYKQIKNILESDQYLLFTGTACQIAGLRQYLDKEYEKLLLIDILCHGVPSPGYFGIYVEHLEKKYKGKVINIEFRNKEKRGWGSEHRTCIYIEKDEGEIHKYRPFLPAYFCAFFWGINLNYSCYKCRYANELRISDITIGDYWGYWNKYHMKFKEGISVVSVSSIKGTALINTNKSNFAKFDALLPEEAKGSNTNFYHPTTLEISRSRFYEINGKKSYFKYVLRTFCDSSQTKKMIISLYGKIVPERVSDYLRFLRGR